MTQVSAASASPSQSDNSTPPQPPPEFLELLHELYSEGEDIVSEASSLSELGGAFDFGPMLDFAQLTEAFFPESVDQILNMATLNDWPNDDLSLPTNQNMIIQAENTPGTSSDSVGYVPGSSSVNEQPSEPLIPRN